MHAEELRQAIAGVVGLLKRSDIRGALDRYRKARGEARTVAAARLGHAGARIMEGMERLSASERRVVRLMHLELLGAPDYWESLLGSTTSDPKVHQAEIVRLATRVMFATSQLPVLASLLGNVESEPVEAPLAEGEMRLAIRLADAGEKASDPDRIARSIDGIDMLYSACASIARKPAVDLRLDGIDGEDHRNLRFSGEHDSLSAVIAVIESIPAALADIDPEGDIDLSAIIGSLPVFDDLRTLGSLGTFSASDLKDISETMHQGALLVLESGVMLIDQDPSPGGGAARKERDRPVRETRPNVPAAAQPAAAASSAASAAPADDAATASSGAGAGRAANGSVDSAEESAPAGTDEHYEHYLREREAMRTTAVNGASDNAANQRRNAVEELLRSLNQSREGG